MIGYFKRVQHLTSFDNPFASKGQFRYLVLKIHFSLVLKAELLEKFGSVWKLRPIECRSLFTLQELDLEFQKE